MDSFRIQGFVEFTLKRGKKIIRKFKRKNLITNLGLETLAKGLLIGMGSGVIIGDVYIGLGSDDGLPFVPSPSITDLALANELPDINIPRKIVAAGDMVLDSNHAVLEVEFATDEGNPDVPFNLVDAGVFWDGATVVRNTGVLVSRVLIVPIFPKDPTCDILNVRWIYEFNRKTTT